MGATMDLCLPVFVYVCIRAYGFLSKIFPDPEERGYLPIHPRVHYSSSFLDLG